MTHSWRITFGLLAILSLTAGAQASDELAANLEGINRTIMDMLRQIKTLQSEVQQLRGEMEVQAHTLNAMKATHTMPITPVAPVVMTSIPTPPVAPQAPTVAAPAPSQPVPAAASAKEQSAYDSAFALLRSGGYEEAIKNFRDFLTAYPNSQLAANGQYWIGEAYYVTRRFTEAMAEFKRAVDAYPDSAKTGDALLKMGYIQYELNQTDAAQKSFESVIARFPQSAAAKLATSRLAKMGR